MLELNNVDGKEKKDGLENGNSGFHGRHHRFIGGIRWHFQFVVLTKKGGIIMATQVGRLTIFCRLRNDGLEVGDIRWLFSDVEVGCFESLFQKYFKV